MSKFFLQIILAVACGAFLSDALTLGPESPKSDYALFQDQTEHLQDVLSHETPNPPRSGRVGPLADVCEVSPPEEPRPPRSGTCAEESRRKRVDRSVSKFEKIVTLLFNAQGCY